MHIVKTQFKSGYTLIEILVALSIVGLLFAIGYVNFRDFSRRQAIAGAAKTLQGDVRLAQQQALSGQKPSDLNCAAPSTLIGYNFDVTSSKEYQIYAVCSAGSSSVITKTVTLPSGINVSPGSTNPILFKVLGSGTNIPSGQTSSIHLTQDYTVNDYSISVSSGGDVQ